MQPARTFPTYFRYSPRRGGSRRRHFGAKLLERVGDGEYIRSQMRHAAQTPRKVRQQPAPPSFSMN